MTTEDTPMPGKFSWRWGYVDGERLMRDRTERLQDDDNGRDRGHRDDDDADRDGRGRGGSRGWRDTIRRSLSRSARDRVGSRSGQYQSREREQSSNRDRDGGRRRCTSAAPVLQRAQVESRPLVLRSEPVLQLAQEEPVLQLAQEEPALQLALDGLVLQLAQEELALQPPLLEETALGMPAGMLLLSAATDGNVGIHVDLAQEDGELDAHDDALDDAPSDRGVRGRGRSRARSASPRASRRRSRAAQTPPATPDPPSSPTDVCPSPPTSKGSCPPVLLLSHANGAAATQVQLSPFSAASASDGARRALEFLAPSFSSSTASRPPGFDSSSPSQQQTPPFIVDGPITRTPEPSPQRRSATFGPLFRAGQQPLLTPPLSSPPVRPQHRRKTLAGVGIMRTVAFSIRRSSARLKAKRKAAPVAKVAETVVCGGLGIIHDGEEVTEQAMEEFARRFKGQVHDDVLKGMRVLFKVDTPDEEEMDRALLMHGGAAALDQDAELESANANADI